MSKNMKKKKRKEFNENFVCQQKAYLHKLLHKG